MRACVRACVRRFWAGGEGQAAYSRSTYAFNTNIMHAVCRLVLSYDVQGEACEGSQASRQAHAAATTGSTLQVSLQQST
jgi:hypothetical protein